MKTPRILVSLALSLGLSLSLSLASCSDSDVDSNNGNNGNNTEQTDLEWEKQISLQRLLGALADQDSLPSNWNSSSYVVNAPTVGQPLEEANPYSVRLVATSSVEEAYREYCSYVGKSTDGSPTSDTWQMDGIGSVSFTPNNESALYATVKVNIKQLPSLQEIRFVPASALGDNDGDVEYYYSFGDVIQDQNGAYWVCVRPANKSLKLGQSHWCTFHLEESNFKNVETGLTVPTGLAKNQAKSETMVANFLNLLRIIANPDLYSSAKGLDKFNKDKFTSGDVRKLYNSWENRKIWNLIIPKSFQSGKLEEFVDNFVCSSHYQFHVLHYGYTSKFNFFSSSTYKVYDLLMTPESPNPGLFRSTPQVTTINWTKGQEVNLKNVIDKPYDGQYKLFGSGNDEIYDDLLVVRHSTGGQLQGRFFTGADDAEPTKSFSESAPSKRITDIFVVKNPKIGQ